MSFVGRKLITLNKSTIVSGWIQRGATINGDATGDRLGSSISLNSAGDIVAVGAIDADVNGSSSGQLKVFAWGGTAWMQRGTNINGDAAGEQLGLSVSLNQVGDVVAVSSLSYVKVFAWNGTSWVQRGTNITGSSNYKVSLSPSGDVVAVLGSSKVQTFSWNGTAWVQLGADIIGGSSISLAPNVLAIGYPFQGTGVVRIYTWNGTSWTTPVMGISDSQSSISFGHSVSLNWNGSVVAVGCPNLTGNGSGQIPFVGLYSTFNGSLIGSRIRGKATIPQLDFVGDSVSLNSNGNVIVTRSAMTSSDPYKGAVRIYVAQNGYSWVQRGSDYSPSSSISINGVGDVFAYGSTSEAGNAGGAFIYKFS